jgi:hypothetical protein
MDSAQEQIASLLRLEKNYVCSDYIGVHTSKRAKANEHDLVHMLEEFANVVTDQSFTRCHDSNERKECASSSPSPKSSVRKSPSFASLHDVQEVHRLNKAASPSGSSTPNATLPPRDFLFWRQQMYDWACQVVDSFSIEREIVAIAFNLLDRYVAKEEAKSLNTHPSLVITRDDFQLFCMTCLYLAVKVMEPFPRKISIQALVDMSRGFYTAKDITVTESEILETLGWHIHPPTSPSFSRLFWQLFPSGVTAKMRATCGCLTDIALTDGFFIPCKASHVALASVLQAARAEGMPEASIQSFLGSLRETFEEADNLMLRNEKNSEPSDLRAVYRQLEILHNQ